MLNKDEFIFHAGTQEKNSKIYSNGGRVLNFVIKSEEFKKSRDRAIHLIDKIYTKFPFQHFISLALHFRWLYHRYLLGYGHRHRTCGKKKKI